jgi:hypothetical protein
MMSLEGASPKLCEKLPGTSGQVPGIQFGKADCRLLGSGDQRLSDREGAGPKGCPATLRPTNDLPERRLCSFISKFEGLGG